jgi:hypothetical protein
LAKGSFAFSLGKAAIRDPAARLPAIPTIMPVADFSICRLSNTGALPWDHAPAKG